MDCGFNLPSSSFIVWIKKSTVVVYTCLCLAFKPAKNQYSIWASRERKSKEEISCPSTHWLSVCSPPPTRKLQQSTCKVYYSARRIPGMQMQQNYTGAAWKVLQWTEEPPEMQNALGPKSEANQHDCPNAWNVRSRAGRKCKTPQE